MKSSVCSRVPVGEPLSRSCPTASSSNSRKQHGFLHMPPSAKYQKVPVLVSSSVLCPHALRCSGGCVSSRGPRLARGACRTCWLLSRLFYILIVWGLPRAPSGAAPCHLQRVAGCRTGVLPAAASVHSLPGWGGLRGAGSRPRVSPSSVLFGSAGAPYVCPLDHPEAAGASGGEAEAAGGARRGRGEGAPRRSRYCPRPLRGGGAGSAGVGPGA